MANAQYYMAPQSPQRQSTITVTGEATVKVVPDQAQITFGVRGTGETAQAARLAEDESAAKVLAVVQANGVLPEDIKTDFIHIEPRYRYSTSEPESYEVRKSIVITLHDITKFDSVMNAATEAGANMILNIQFLTSDLRKYRDQARAMAMQAARDKAALLTGVLNQRVGPAITVDETGNSWSPGYYSYGNWWGNNNNNQGMSQNVMVAPTESRPTGESSAPGQIQVQAGVRVIFELL